MATMRKTWVAPPWPPGWRRWIWRSCMKRAVATLASSYDFTNAAQRLFQAKGILFTQALIPLEAAHRATREANRELQRRNQTLRRAHRGLVPGQPPAATRNRARRQAGQAALKKGREQYRTLFLESQVMQKKLHQLTRQIISAQEEERKRISRELHDEVVQTLVGINVELSA